MREVSTTSSMSMSSFGNTYSAQNSASRFGLTSAVPHFSPTAERICGVVIRGAIIKN